MGAGIGGRDDEDFVVAAGAEVWVGVRDGEPVVTDGGRRPQEAGAAQRAAARTDVKVSLTVLHRQRKGHVGRRGGHTHFEQRGVSSRCDAALGDAVGQRRGTATPPRHNQRADRTAACTATGVAEHTTERPPLRNTGCRGALRRTPAHEWVCGVRRARRAKCVPYLPSKAR